MKVPALESKRTQQILADIVRTYIETGEPVSSRSIARLFPETLSPATVRNVMADLEEEGFLFQPHTSAGRVPTASAYRFFVEEVAAQGTASHEDREWIRTELRTAQTPDALLERASHVLASISRGLGIIISPPLAKTTVEHLRFLLLPDGRVLVVLVAKGGMTRDKVIRTERTFAQEELDRISDYLNQTLSAMDAGSHSRGPARQDGAGPGTVWENGQRRAAAVRSQPAGRGRQPAGVRGRRGADCHGGRFRGSGSTARTAGGD